MRLMSGESTSSFDGRVVILSRDASLAASANVEALRLEYVSVCTGYEAAAELLAAPTAVLIIDLRLLTTRHLRLLEIAREMRVEMLAVGVLPAKMTSDDLSGLRLIGRSELAASLESSLTSQMPYSPAEVGPQPAETQAETPSPQADQPSEPAVKLAPAKTTPAKLACSPKAGRPADEDAFAWDELDEELISESLPVKSISKSNDLKDKDDEGSQKTPEKRQDSPQKQAGQGDVDDLLTPEEIAALLGDSP